MPGSPSSPSAPLQPSTVLGGAAVGLAAALMYFKLKGKDQRLTVGETQALLRKADAVVFDVDSTVCQDEAIDVLADFHGCGEQVAAVTKQAMEGGMLFQDALKARLDVIQPSVARLQVCLQERPPRLTAGIKELVFRLHASGKQVYLISGGFRQMIAPVAEELGIRNDHIIANRLLFDREGNYAGFDPAEPTSRSGGKAVAVQSLKDNHGYKTVIMIGDGVTDMEARPPADAFIGFGGVVERAKVKAGADWFVTDFRDIQSVLPLP